MNFVYLSPNFPESSEHFCKALKQKNVRVLGIGDADYNLLSTELKNSLEEYQKVSNLENYHEVKKACKYFEDKYGKIDWLESNNEYWLLKDAALRTDFNISTGLNNDTVAGIKYKSAMKEYYEKAKVKVARHHLVKDYENCIKFIGEVGYPLIVKPDNGVGASSTYKISNLDEFNYFYETKSSIQYIMEEFIQGELVSYDGIAGKNREVIFATSHRFPIPVMELVNDKKDVVYYTLREMPETVRIAGESVIKAFETNSRFFHCEFFIMTEDKDGLGKKGDIIGLEVNMRPPGGYIPDMMNYASDVDVYEIWANMITSNEEKCVTQRPYFCVSAARRDGKKYLHTQRDTEEKYKDDIMIKGRMPEAVSAAMGNDMIIARFKEFSMVEEFIDFYLKKT